MSYLFLMSVVYPFIGNPSVTLSPKFIDFHHEFLYTENNFCYVFRKVIYLLMKLTICQLPKN